ncbi:hypothetical protein JZ751_025106 [Albula glossodonta]|uniref:Ubiquitin-like protease family profile domain-containing protein n=1 Tax=Albula glossodonta TaxID=121402 RepID=A0A8T2PFB7_9TELE|nr:hypothetical protein JZ751_025106 [Albula glossodonta]
MYDCHWKRAVNVTTLAIFPYTWPGVNAQRSYKRSQPHCNKRRHIKIVARGVFKDWTAVKTEASKKSSKVRHKLWLSPRPIHSRFVAKVVQNGTGSCKPVDQLKYFSSNELAPANGLVVNSEGSTSGVHATKYHKCFPKETTIKVRNFLTYSNLLCNVSVCTAGLRNRLITKEASSKQLEIRKRSVPTDDNDAAVIFLLLMRCLFNVQNRCRVGKSHIGSLGKERKAKNVTRISTLKGRRLKAEVLGYLSSLNAESKELIREVNGDDLLRLKRKSHKGSERDGVEPTEVGTMVHDGSVPGSAPAHGRTSGRKRTPKACDCCGPNCRPQPAKALALEKPLGKRGRKKKVLEAAEQEQQPTPPPPAGDDLIPLNGASSLEGDSQQHSSDMEVEQHGSEVPVLEVPVLEVSTSEVPVVEVPKSVMPVLEVSILETPELEVPVSESPELKVPILEPLKLEALTESNPRLCANPLLDHRYCKTEDGDTGCASEQGEETGLTNQLLTTDITDEDLTELIHEFLEHFYGKYGSFIPLSEGDVLEHLNKKLSTNLINRKSFICSAVAKYRDGLACAPMHYFKVTYNKHTLTLEDLSTLDDQNWVNDQVINMYGELIMEAVNHKVHFFNSFFHRQLVAKGYEGVKRWTKKVDLFTKSLLLIPIHLEIHWSLITVDITNQNIHFYDSQGIMFKYAVENILKYILAEAKEKQNTVYQKGWKMIVNKSIPQQKNDSDCGVFVLEYCKCLALKEPLQFTQEDMPKVRKRIYKELCECKLKC